jgi:hypothetical protein
LRPEARPESRPEPKPEAKPDSEPQEVARPEAEEPAAQAEPSSSRSGRNKRLDAKRLARRPGEAPEDRARPGADGRISAQPAVERGPDGRRLSAKQKLSKRGRPGGEEPKDSAKDSKDPFEKFFREQPKSDSATEEPSGVEPPKGEGAKVDSGKPDFGRPDSANSRPDEGARPAGDGPSQSAKVDPPAKEGEASTPRPDAAPPVISVPPPSVAAAPQPPPAGPPTPPISQ